MKKLILSLALCCATTTFFAQEADLAKLRNDGIAALEAKDYQSAYNNFSSYLNQTNNQDSVIAFNCGLCADKIKKPADALKYFDIAVQKKYNLVNAYIGKASALKDLKKTDEYIATIKEGLKEVPGDKSLTKMYANHYLNTGIIAQKGGKTAAAEEAFKEVLNVQENNINALYSLGVLKYNDASKTLATDRAKAKTIYTEAKGYLESAAKLLTNPKQKAMLDNVNNMLKQIDIQLQAE